ncbi:MAG: UDP-N-acetylmuramoyl-tripeptide--D-alanyl-D-alanine ligase [Dokdonella sp.]
MNLRLSDVASNTQGRLIGEDVAVRSIATDSRTLAPGALYVAIRGERFDGHEFVRAAQASGAVAALVDKEILIDLPQVVVTNTELALGSIAAAARQRSNARVVAITGSNGKTTVKTLLAAVLSAHGSTHASSGNYNNEIGLPMSVIALPADARFAVFEMGAGKPGDIAYLMSIAKPDIGLVNNVGAAHLERLGSLDGVARAKGAIISGLPADGVAIINADDAFADYFIGLAGSRRLVRYGVAVDAQVRGEVVGQPAGSFRIVHGAQSVSITLGLAGSHNVSNALAVAAIAIALDVPLATIKAGLESVVPVAGRLATHRHRSGAIVIDDSYNANPDSFAAAIATLADQRGRRILVMGDMKELGPGADELHEQVGSRASDAGIDELHAVGDFSAFAVRAFDGAAFLHDSQDELIAALRPLLENGTTVLVKGSRSSAMDKVVNALLASEGDANAA